MTVTLVAPEPEPATPPRPAVVETKVETKVEPQVQPPVEPPLVEHAVEPEVQPEPPAPIQQPKPKPKAKPVHKPVAKQAPKEPAPPVQAPAASTPQAVPIRPAPAPKAAPAASSANLGPRPINRTEPAYPERARALGIEGTVKIQFDVNNDGLLENVQVISATPRNVFEREIRQVTRRWRYESGKPGKNLVVTIQFKLTGVSSAAD